MKFFRNATSVIRIIYALCLTGATYNHARQVFEHGLSWDYGGLPAFVCIYWTSLTFLDAFVVILLLTRLRLGVALTFVIITSDVVVNSWVGMHYGFQLDMYIAQVLFLVFVLLTVRTAWRVQQRNNLEPDIRTLAFPPEAKGR